MRRIWSRIFLVVLCLALLAVCIVFSVSATFNPFIYFRF